MGLFDAFKKMVGGDSDDDDQDNDGDDGAAKRANEHVADYKGTCAHRRQGYRRGRDYYAQVPAMHGVSHEQYLRLMVEMGRITSGNDHGTLLAKYGLSMETLQALMQYWGGHMMTGGQGASEYWGLETERVGLEMAQSRYRDHALHAWKCRLEGEVIAGEPPVTVEEFVRLRKGIVPPGTYTPDDVKCLEIYWDTRRDCDYPASERFVALDD